MSYPTKLRVQLKLYDIITKAERRRLIKAFPKYGDSYKKDDMLDEAIEEILDLFGYIIMEKMKRYEPGQPS